MDVEWREKYSFTYVLIFWVTGAIFGIGVGISCERDRYFDMREQAIEQDCSEFNHKTGEFQWVCDG